MVDWGGEGVVCGDSRGSTNLAIMRCQSLMIQISKALR